MRLSRTQKQLAVGVAVVAVLLASSLRLLAISPYQASATRVQYFRAEVVNVQRQSGGYQVGSLQMIKARLLDGPQKGNTVPISRSVSFGDTSYQRLPTDSTILVTRDRANGPSYSYSERWHVPGVATLCILLLVLVVLIGRWRGITSMLGLVISIGVLSLYVLPQILAGHNPFAVCIIGAVLITIISLYVAHGVSRRTSVALIGSLVTLAASVGLTSLASYLTGTSEVIDEASSSILYSAHPVSLSGLLTGGIIIAFLGVLYDVTTGQAAAVDELRQANSQQTFRQLYARGLSIGREHIAALVNTLALVYVGIALPSIVVTALYNHAPLIVVLNSEVIVEEVVRSVVASLGMLLAVPITTALAAYLLPRWPDDLGQRVNNWLSGQSS